MPKGIQFGNKDIQLFQCADDMLVNIENAKKSTKKALKANKWLQ